MRWRGPNKSVMLIDDNEDIIDLLSLMLRRHGHEVMTALTGAEGLELLSKGPYPDLILLDVVLPDMTGSQVLDRIECTRPDVLSRCEIFFYTAGAPPDDRRVAGSLNKMLDVKQILTTIVENILRPSLPHETRV
jgi:CheY-like chemotaxis protein